MTNFVGPLAPPFGTPSLNHTDQEQPHAEDEIQAVANLNQNKSQ